MLSNSVSVGESSHHPPRPGLGSRRDRVGACASPLGCPGMPLKGRLPAGAGGHGRT